MLILAKQFNLVKSVKQQISSFPYFHPSIRTLCRNLHDHKLCIFTPNNFTRNQHLIKVKQKDHIPSMHTIGLVFFLARACQHKTNKIGITIFALLQLKLCILQDRNKFKSTYLAQFNSLIKIPQTIDFIFLSNSTLQDESKKIWFTPFGYSQLQI